MTVFVGAWCSTCGVSTSIDVFPLSAYQPSFREVRDLTQQRYNDLLARHDVPYRIDIEVILSRSHDRATESDLDARWLADTGATFLYCVDGTTAAASWPACMSDDDPDIEGHMVDEWEDRLPASTLEQARRIGYWWSDHRPMGGRAVSSVGYGLVAAAISELADGLICSSDNAFPEEWSPMRHEEFLARWGDDEIQWHGVERFRDGSVFR